MRLTTQSLGTSKGLITYRLAGREADGAAGAVGVVGREKEDEHNGEVKIRLEHIQKYPR